MFKEKLETAKENIEENIKNNKLFRTENLKTTKKSMKIDNL